LRAARFGGRDLLAQDVTAQEGGELLRVAAERGEPGRKLKATRAPRPRRRRARFVPVLRV